MKKLLFIVPFFLSCGDARIPPQGPTGPQGPQGINGYSAAVLLVTGAAGCSNGGITIMTALDTNRNFVLDTDDMNIQTAEVCNGLNGQDGQDGQDGQNAVPGPFYPTQIIDPCGKQAAHDEILLKLYNGSILASFSDTMGGVNTRFALLTAGNFRTTDGTNCSFSVDSSGNIYNEHN